MGHILHYSSTLAGTPGHHIISHLPTERPAALFGLEGQSAKLLDHGAPLNRFMRTLRVTILLQSRSAWRIIPREPNSEDMV